MGFSVINLGVIQPYRAGVLVPRPKRIQQAIRSGNVHEFKEDLEEAIRHSKTGRIRQAYHQQAHYHHKARHIAVYAFQIMTSPVLSLIPDSDLNEAWALFNERRFQHVPITSDYGVVMGIVSDRDLLREAAKSIDEKVTAQKNQQSVTVRDIMKTEVLVATPNTEIRQIAKTMIDEHVGSMPIVENQSQLVGIVTRGDILRTLVNQAPLELWV